RNIAVTAPYMHNGVFERLETALFFYNQYLVRNAEVGINPETGAPWGPPENPQNIAHELLEGGHPMDAERIETLIAFLRTLTDRRYEHLLEPSLEDHHE
ncbi:MAG: methylamine utilization protein MauG, partial [Gammaproteobacteria bacterium]